jgi:transcriptional regulator with XRE-family HTH domain
MDIKSKIEELLHREDYTFSQLAEYLQMTESQLAAALGDRSVELRSLEAISKALRVPLYSFFRGEDGRIDFSYKPYYVNRLWTGDDEKKSRSQLEQEIDLLKQLIQMKEQQLAKLN